MEHPGTTRNKSPNEYSRQTNKRFFWKVTLGLVFAFSMSPSAVYSVVFKGFQECFEFPIFLVLEHVAAVEATDVIIIDHKCNKNRQMLSKPYILERTPPSIQVRQN